MIKRLIGRLLRSLGLPSAAFEDPVIVEKDDFVGTWEDRDSQYIRGFMTYRRDGSWYGDLVVTLPDKPEKPVRLRGRWRLDGNRLTYQTTWSSDPDFPLYSGVDVIVAITETRYDFRMSDDDEIHSCYRANSDYSEYRADSEIE